MMKRNARVYLNDLNPGKLGQLVQFLALCHDMQLFQDLRNFWLVVPPSGGKKPPEGGTTNVPSH